MIGGLFDRKEGWGLTWRGRFLVTGLVLALGLSFVLGIHPFLATKEPVPARLLVIEGWSPPATLKQVAAAYHSGNYERAVLIRPVLDLSDPYESGRSSAQWVARRLVANGIPDDELTTLLPIVARRDRTYHSALTVKDWLRQQGASVKAFNVATLGPHARRSHLLYEKAFGEDVNIGIIQLSGAVYDPKHWWRTSEGLQEVLGESVAYMYARFLFSPSDSDSQGQPSATGQEL